MQQLQDKLDTSKHGSAGSKLHQIMREALQAGNQIMETNEDDFGQEMSLFNQKSLGFFSGTTASRVSMLQAQLIQNQQQNRLFQKEIEAQNLRHKG